jgi:predicted RNase H-like HicB family nuclease
MVRKEAITAAEYGYTILLQPEPEGGYTVTCPALPGLVTYGASLAEARAMAADAIVGYLECLREDGDPIPESDAPASQPLVEQIRVKLPSP